MSDRRSDEAKAYRKLYNSKAWQQLRWSILTRDEFTCQKCSRLEGDPSQLVADHRQPHRGDLDLFWSEANVWTLCKPCHDRDKQSEERIGFSKAIGRDGWPVDDRHPANGGKPVSREGLGAFSHPAWFRPVVVPLTIVCGPPASGKTTYVETHKAAGDLVIDLDAIAMRAHGVRAAFINTEQLIGCIKIRNEMLGDLMREKAKGTCNRAWLIASEAKPHRRQWWADVVKPGQIVVIETPADECIRRARADAINARSTTVDVVIRKWWTDYRRRKGDVIVR